MRYLDSEIAMVQGMPKLVAEAFIKAHREKTNWAEVRAYLDSVGFEAMDRVVADGIPPEVAGRRLAEFNDMFIEELRK